MWNYDSKNHLLIYKSSNFYYSSSICIFSFIQTLVKKYYVGNNLTLFHPYILNFLKLINNDGNGGSIIILENNFWDSIKIIKEMISCFFKLIDNENNKIPFYIIFSLKKNKFKKPHTNIWKLIEKSYQDNNKSIDLNASIYIGCNAGRDKNKIYIKDNSDIDRALCENIKIKIFKTPEQIFLNDYSIRNWSWNNKIISIDKRIEIIKNQSDNEIIFSNFVNLNKKQIIMISGPPCSGKTMLGNRIKRYIYDNINNKNIITLDINYFNNQQECLYNLNDVLNNNRGDYVILIDTLGLQSIRKNYIDLIDEFDDYYDIVFVDIITTKEICLLLNQFKLEISRSSNIKEIPTYIFNNYFINYSKIENIKIENIKIKYIEFPLILRKRDELFYHY
jgi:DNA 3'-phosphatase